MDNIFLPGRSSFLVEAPTTPFILITRHEVVLRALLARNYTIAAHYQFFRGELLKDFPPESHIIGNLPIPVVARICAAGHHYYHTVIPSAGANGSFSFPSLVRNMSIVEFHVAAID